jgi:hypothetical protein
MKQFKDTDYYITETGEIWSKKYHPQQNPNCKLKKLKPRKDNSHGYLMVWLQIDGKNTGKLIHRLVGEIFLPNPENKPQINHIDGNKLNNHISNLEWCTSSHNNKHAYQIGLKKPIDTKGQKNGNSKLTQQQVLEIRELYSSGNYSQKELSKKFQVGTVQIHRIVNNKLWKHI